MRMRPITPEELDMVDWKGRWIDDDEEYDEEEEEEDRLMEDFDPVSTRYTMTVLDGFLYIHSRTPVTEKTTTMKRRRKRKRALVPLGFR